MRNNALELIERLVENFKQIVKLLESYPGCKITFLETPAYSIYDWNKHNYTDLKQLEADDKNLLEYIKIINVKVRDINNTLNTRSPSFSADISHPINRSKKESKKTIRDYYNFDLYSDGIHPKA